MLGLIRFLMSPPVTLRVYDIVTQGNGGTLAVESSEGEEATFIGLTP